VHTASKANVSKFTWSVSAEMRKKINNDWSENKISTRRKTAWYEYAMRNNMFQHHRDKSNPDFAYTLMSGGVLNVPIERQRELLRHLALDIDNGFLPDFNEISPPITRLYMDLDFKAESTAHNSVQLFTERIVKRKKNGSAGTEKFPAIIIEERPLERRRLHNIFVAMCIAQKVKEYFPGKADPRDIFFHAHCMWRPGKFVTETLNYVNDEGQHVRETRIVKRTFGMHIVWPNIHVTHEQALHLREGVIRALAAKFQRKNNPNNRTEAGLNSWEDVVDENVYLPVPSMRMVLSDKYQSCPECGQRNQRLYGSRKRPPKRSFGEEEFQPFHFHCMCRGSGKIACNSIYQYEATVDADNCEVTDIYKRLFKNNTMRLLVQCSLRDPRRPDLIRKKCFREDDCTMQLPDDAPRYPKFAPDKNDTLSTATERATQYHDKLKKMTAGARQYVADKRHELLSVDSKEFAAVQNIFNNVDSVMEQARARLRRGCGTKARKRKAGEKVDRYGDDNADGLTAKALIKARKDASTVENLLDLMPYANLSVYRLRRGEIGGNFYYLVDVANNGLCENASYCNNVQRLHKCEKNVYFKITLKNGITQKCLCWGKTDRLLSCKKYESPPCPLPKSAQSVLFSDALLQRKLTAQEQEIMIASTHRPTPSAGRRHTDIERTFDVVAIRRSEEDLLNRYLKSHSCHETKSVSSVSNNDSSSSGSTAQSPWDPLDNMLVQRYEKMRQSQQEAIIDVGTIERKTLSDDNSVEEQICENSKYPAQQNAASDLTQGELKRVAQLLGDAPRKRKFNNVLTNNEPRADQTTNDAGIKRPRCDKKKESGDLLEERVDAIYDLFSDSSVREPRLCADK